MLVPMTVILPSATASVRSTNRLGRANSPLFFEFALPTFLQASLLLLSLLLQYRQQYRLV